MVVGLVIASKNRGTTGEYEFENHICRKKCVITPYKFYSRAGVNSLFFSENGYSNHICFNVSVRFNNIIAEQNPNRISEDQTKKIQFILSLHKQGLGYRRIAKVLNEKGIRTHKGSEWGGNYVYAVLKRYRERLEREKFRKLKYEPEFSKMWVEFSK